LPGRGGLTLEAGVDKEIIRYAPLKREGREGEPIQVPPIFFIKTRTTSWYKDMKKPFIVIDRKSMLDNKNNPG
jgi:hypothetical protein